jgi:hypothetical protein
MGLDPLTNPKVCGAKSCNKPTPTVAAKKMRIAIQRWQGVLAGVFLDLVFVFDMLPPAFFMHMRSQY